MLDGLKVQLIFKEIFNDGVVIRQGKQTIYSEATEPHPKGEKFGIIFVFPHNKKMKIFGMMTPVAKLNEQIKVIQETYDSIRF